MLVASNIDGGAGADLILAVNGRRTSTARAASKVREQPELLLSPRNRVIEWERIVPTGGYTAEKQLEFVRLLVAASCYIAGSELGQPAPACQP